MIREYINNLLNENNEKLKNLEQQLKELIVELDNKQKLLKSLQSESNTDETIFSPRSVNDNLKNDMEDVKTSISKTKQDIEYVKSFMETYLVKKQEYEKLLEELNIMQDEKLEHFFADLYRKTEVCLDLLYNDRAKCKNELKSMKYMIQNKANSLNKEYNS